MSGHRFNVNFSDTAWADLQRLSVLKEMPIAEVLRDAIALERWFDEQIREGNKILVESSGGRVREVIPR